MEKTAAVVDPVDTNDVKNIYTQHWKEKKKIKELLESWRQNEKDKRTLQNKRRV